MTNTHTPALRNDLVWLDLGERIEQALNSLRDIETQRGTSERLRAKIEGVQEAQAEFQRLTAEGTPYPSILAQWLSLRLVHPASNNQRKRGHGYSLVLDYTRAY